MRVILFATNKRERVMILDSLIAKRKREKLEILKEELVNETVQCCGKTDNSDAIAEIAESAFVAYKHFSEIGVGVQELLNLSAEKKNEIGTYIHANWMARNLDSLSESTKHIFVAYDEVEESKKQLYLDVFHTLMQIVEAEYDIYAIKELPAWTSKQKGMKGAIAAWGSPSVSERHVLEKVDQLLTKQSAVGKR